MDSHARVVVIGGGVTGCAILYHLAKMGWTDVVLLERKELTSGSSWHAAGSLFALTSPSNAAILQKYTIELYPKLEAESGQSCGYHPTGGVHLARTDDQVMALHLLQSRGKRNGIEFGIHRPCRGAADRAHPQYRWPQGRAARAAEGLLRSGRRHPGLCQGGARHGRQGPSLHARASRRRQTPNGEWDVVTPAGTIRAQVLVNAAGLWAREVAALAGIKLPLLPVEHHYMVTETIPEIADMKGELPNISEPSGGYYSRQEGKGLLLGAYEATCTHWAEEGTPADFGHELLPDDLQRIEVNLARAIEALPCLQTAGIKRVINGPMIFSPDLGPLLGPYPGLKNYFCAAGVMTGFNQGAGIGKVMAEWIIEGEPSLDVFFWDVARFGAWAGKRYTKARTKYFYEHRTDIVYPFQEFEAGRPIRTFPIHDRLAKAGAVFGLNFGFEYPVWYARNGEAREDRYGFNRGNWFEAVGEECRAVRDGVGLLEISTFAKYLVSGPVPPKPGSTGFSPIGCPRRPARPCCRPC